MFQPSQRLPLGRRALLTIVAALAVAVPGSPQTTSSQPGTSGSGEYSIIEVNPFAGYQWFQIFAKDEVRVSEFEPRPVVGVRVTEDLWKYVGLEQSFTLGFNDLRLRPFGQTQKVDTDARNYTLAINPVLHFRPRESRFRPFVTAGPGITWYVPDKQLKTAGVANIVPPVSELKTKYGPALIYGGGVKINATSRFGLRFDVRGLWTQGRYFQLPDFPSGAGSFYSPHHGTEHAISVTGGVTFRFGQRSEAAPVAPPPPPAPPAPKPTANITITSVTGARDVCPGENVELQAAATGWLPDQTPSYQWTVNGQAVPGATGSTFNVPTTESGTKNITVTVSVPESSKTSDPVTMRVKEAGAPTVQFPIDQTTIPAGTKLPLNATAKGSECGGPATLRYTASEGTITDSTFDSSTVAFDPARTKQQSKPVHLTATATDQKGGTASASNDVTVTLSPEARRLDDIVFPAGNARVNNCAKRLLLEQLTPMLRDDPNATVILIGHRDERERGKAAARLDRTRTLNAAAVLSAGTGICPQLELSRVKVNWVGTDQSSQPRPQLCGTSTEVKERSGQAVKANDPRAQYRRVEVWFVPGGAATPSGITGLQEVPGAEVKKLGCPK